MKQQISITVEEELVKQSKKLIREGSFRNKSHVFEYALQSLLRTRGDE
jgi:Arc/MetJ-type ribon-helix-helix transcriptional regulator